MKAPLRIVYIFENSRLFCIRWQYSFNIWLSKFAQIWNLLNRESAVFRIFRICIIFYTSQENLYNNFLMKKMHFLNQWDDGLLFHLVICSYLLLEVQRDTKCGEMLVKKSSFSDRKYFYFVRKKLNLCFITKN